ncbi:Uncharacterised protein [Serratia ficaria]|uniref:hypothetical protein n=1 Tax=Serratia ficaria TaxID=61651 RepID=UPI002177BA38|nr:hypothetical protein [Serratia ficaria]CAI1024352.1 Uncharacterised protein [Serratia ficaria]CAI1859047.1 Uncharacterised protein [Serratia ficaria]CAI2472182.1 Uncharacterised protein [Serratia ficaria]
MTQTLTTEQLRARAAHLRAKAEQWRGQGYAGKAARLDGDADALDELAANREAQPVAYLNKFSGVCMTLEQQPNAADDVAVYAPLYTAPPAPANANPVALVDRCIAACPGASLSVGLAPAVPAVPAVPEDVRQALRDMDDEIVAELDTEKTACRAAMPAQPVSQGYKLPDDTRRMDWLVSHYVAVRQPLVYGSRAMFTAQQVSDDHEEHKTDLREQIDAAMLAAAPEGGSNG